MESGREHFSQRGAFAEDEDFTIFFNFCGVASEVDGFVIGISVHDKLQLSPIFCNEIQSRVTLRRESDGWRKRSQSCAGLTLGDGRNCLETGVKIKVLTSAVTP